MCTQTMTTSNFVLTLLYYIEIVKFIKYCKDTIYFSPRGDILFMSGSLFMMGIRFRAVFIREDSVYFRAVFILESLFDVILLNELGFCIHYKCTVQLGYLYMKGRLFKKVL